MRGSARADATSTRSRNRSYPPAVSGGRRAFRPPLRTGVNIVGYFTADLGVGEAARGMLAHTRAARRAVRRDQRDQHLEPPTTPLRTSARGADRLRHQPGLREQRPDASGPRGPRRASALRSAHDRVLGVGTRGLPACDARRCPVRGRDLDVQQSLRCRHQSRRRPARARRATGGPAACAAGWPRSCARHRRRLHLPLLLRRQQLHRAEEPGGCRAGFLRRVRSGRGTDVGDQVAQRSVRREGSGAVARCGRRSSRHPRHRHRARPRRDAVAHRQLRLLRVAASRRRLRLHDGRGDDGRRAGDRDRDTPGTSSSWTTATASSSGPSAAVSSTTGVRTRPAPCGPSPTWGTPLG